MYIFDNLYLEIITSYESFIHKNYITLPLMHLFVIVMIPEAESSVAGRGFIVVATVLMVVATVLIVVASELVSSIQN